MLLEYQRGRLADDVMGYSREMVRKQVCCFFPKD